MQRDDRPRLVIVGAGGQLGSELSRLVHTDWRFSSWQGLTRAQCDIADLHRVRYVLADQRRGAGRHGTVVINAAGYTNVDGAETDEDGAYAVNAAGPAHLALACSQFGVRLIHVSTDYVFSGEFAPGEPRRPYEVGDEPDPRSAYGRTKLAGEQAVRELLPDAGWVVRTAWVYGAVGHNFVKTMARLAATRPTVDVVDDQYGSPTWARDLAAGLLDLAATGPPAGVYHATNAGQTTWCGFARAIFRELGHDPERVRPTTTAAFPRPAPRPAWSVLSPQAWVDAGLAPLRDWRDALGAAITADRAAYAPVD